MVVYECEETLESVLTAVYNAYEERRTPEETGISFGEELRLFAEYVPVSTDITKANRVLERLHRSFGEEDVSLLCMALSSEAPERGEAFYRTVADGLRRSPGRGHLFDNLADHWVHTAFSLGRGAANECHHYKGFLRFRELKSGILMAVFAPKNRILDFLMFHFQDRLPKENFMIYDEKREMFGVHESGREWYLVSGRGMEIPGKHTAMSEEEEKYQELFAYFCRRIAIESRRNEALQQKLLPKRFQEYMIEFGTKHTK